MEIWKDIKGFEGYYQVSNEGRVKRIQSLVRTGIKNNEYKLVPEKIIGLRVKNNGYLEVQLSKNGKISFKLVHRLVAEAFCEKTSEDQTQVNHINFNKRDNRAINLEWVTNRENIEHAMKNKLYYNPIKNEIYCKELDKTFLGSYEAAIYLNNFKFGNTRNVRKLANKIRCACLGYQSKAYGYHWIYTKKHEKYM